MYPEQTIEQNVQAHGRNLMGISAVVMSLVGAYVLWTLALPWLHPERMDAAFVLAHYDLVLSDPTALGNAMKAALGITVAIEGLAWLLPLWMLYQLARCFNRENALNLATATAVRRLAHAIVLSVLVLPLAGGFVFAFVQMSADFSGIDIHPASSGRPWPVYLVELGLGITLPLVACTCLYSLAWLIQRGAEASDDAKSIV